MERRDIEVLLMFADELHFARTAERLHLSPAAVSQTIGKLERSFGAPLFVRTTRRVELTPLDPAHTYDYALTWRTQELSGIGQAFARLAHERLG